MVMKYDPYQLLCKLLYLIILYSTFVYKAWKIRKYLSYKEKCLSDMGSNFSCFSTSHMVSSLLQRINNPDKLKICSYKYGYCVSNNQFDFKLSLYQDY